MNTLVRSHFNPRGRPKRAWPTFADVDKFIRDHPGLRSAEAYECDVCHRWHLTTHPQR